MIAARITDNLLEAILRIHDAGPAPDPAERILRALAPFFATDKGVLVRIHKHQSHAISWNVIGFESRRSREAFESNAPAADFIYIAAKDHPAGSTHIGTELVLPEVMHSSPLYRLIAVPANVEYMVGGVIENNTETYASIGFWRAESAGNYDQNAKKMLAMTLPHIRQALSVHQLLGDEKNLSAQLRVIGLQAIERSRSGIAFLDRRGQIVWMNREAQRIGWADDGISISRGRIRLRTQSLQKQFDNLLQERRRRANEEPLPASKSLRVRHKTPGLDYEVLVIPIRNHRHQIMLPREAAILVLINDPGALFRVPAARLVQNYGLTPAEARLCEALARTGSLSDAAAASEIGLNTARSHLKGIFAKLEVSSQVQLLQRLGANLRFPSDDDVSQR